MVSIESESTLARPRKPQRMQRDPLETFVRLYLFYTQDLPVTFKVTLKKSCSIGYGRTSSHVFRTWLLLQLYSTTFSLFCGLLIGPQHDQWCSELWLNSLLNCFSPTHIRTCWHLPLLSSHSKCHPFSPLLASAFNTYHQCTTWHYLLLSPLLLCKFT